MAARICFPNISKTLLKLDYQYKLQLRCHALSQCQQVISSRRKVMISAAPSLILLAINSNCLMPLPVWAEEKSSGREKGDEGIVGTIKLLFDPNEKTKSGKLLPKAYLKSAREVVKTLRESLKEDSEDITKFRRTADAAKESIRYYLSNWRGQQAVINEESYLELEKAIRSLATFYSKAGPSAVLPEKVKTEILNDLDTAEAYL